MNGSSKYNRRLSSFSRNPHFPVSLNETAAASSDLFALRPIVRDARSVLLETEEDLHFVEQISTKYGLRTVVTSPTGHPKRDSEVANPSFIFEEWESKGSSKKNSRSDSSPSTNLDSEDWVQLPCALEDGNKAERKISVARNSLAPLNVVKEQKTTNNKKASLLSTPITPRYPATAYSSFTLNARRSSSIVYDDGAEVDMPLTEFLHVALQFQKKRLTELEYYWKMEDILFDSTNTYYKIVSEEGESRERLALLFIEVTEQAFREYITKEYNKFVVFCVQREPVWRKAARELQVRNEEWLNSSENIYARFLLQETAVREKLSLFQESVDYVYSLKVVERESLREATQQARQRRKESLRAQPMTSHEILPPALAPRRGPTAVESTQPQATVPRPPPNKPTPSGRPAPAKRDGKRPMTGERPHSGGSGKSGRSKGSAGKERSKDAKGNGVKSKEPTSLFGNIKKLV